MDLNSLPNEILIQIMDFSTQPNMFFAWLLTCKHLYQLCVTNDLSEKMKIRFTKSVLNYIDGEDQLKITDNYPNGDILRVKKYSMIYNAFGTNNQALSYFLVKERIYNLFYSIVPHNNHFNTLIEYSYIGPILFEKKVDNANLYKTSTISKKCTYENDILHGLFEDFQSSISCRINHGVMITYDSPHGSVVFKPLDSANSDPSNDLSLNNPFDYYYANFIHHDRDYNIVVKDGILMKFVYRGPNHIKYNYNGSDISMQTVSYYCDNISFINLIKTTGVISAQFNHWMDHTNLPIRINGKGKIVQKPLKFPVFEEFE